MAARFHRQVLSLAALACLSLTASAQQPSAPKAPAATQTAPPQNVALPASTTAVAPQVNSVVHRINGFKMLNLLRRNGAKVAPLSDEMLMADEVHTSITAGFMLDDGSVVARLPQGQMEVPALAPVATGAPLGTQTATAPQAPNLFTPQPNLLIVQRDGQQLPARFLGLDGGTGLSLLEVYGQRAVPRLDVKEENLMVGQRVRLLAPARAAQAESLSLDKLYFNLSEINGRLVNIARTNTGKVTSLTVQADKLSPEVVGAVALNEAGETIGMVESSGANQVNLIPVAAVRRAVERIRARLDSKPQPWLGVRGEAVAGTSLEQLMSVGWKYSDAFKLMNRRVGVLLTSVAPETPAWMADLRSGDVVMRVGAGDVKSAENFSSLLREASGGQVRFTVLRPNFTAPRTVTVKLSEALNPVLEMEAAEARASRRKSTDPLVSRGLETFPMTHKLSEYFKASGGLLVVSVHPESAAARAGLQAGDVIETLNGKPLDGPLNAASLPSMVTLGVIRDGRKLEIKLAGDEVKQR